VLCQFTKQSQILHDLRYTEVLSTPTLASLAVSNEASHHLSDIRENRR
jgi:hypothetical protein